MSAPRALEWWSERALAAQASALEAALAAWCADWGVARAGARCMAANAGASMPASRAWRACGEPAALAWISLPESLPAAIEHTLFGGVSPGAQAWVGRVATRASADFVAHLCAALKLPRPAASDTPPEALWRRWSGAVVLDFELCGCGVSVLLTPGQAAGLLGPRPMPAKRPAVSPLADALPIELAATLEPFSLALDQIHHLQAGDVLHLPHRLDAPLHLAADGVTPLTAWLGEKDGARAILLSSKRTQTHRETKS